MIQLPKTAVITLGCPKNQVDAEQLLSLLAREGFPLVGQMDEAETIIVNTCAFIQPAVEESLDAILEIAGHKEDGHCRHLVVMGCLPQRYGQELLRQIPEIDLALGTSSFQKLPKLLLKLLHGESPARLHVSQPDYRNTCGLPQNTSQPHTAYLKIAEGCDNHCSYCIIPQIRGKQTSFPLAELTRKASELAVAGVKELNIIAQDITAYGQKLAGRPTLVQLLEKLNKIDGLEWIRLLYAYPGKVSDELITLLGEQTKICPYLDIPIQHISEPVLKRMNRHDRSQTIRETIYKLGSLKRTIHLRSTVIVGFPGETDRDFQLLLDFIGEGHFTYLGCFPYWPETGTKAAMMEAQIEESVKEERCQAIMDCQRQVTSRHLQEYIGKNIPLLMEGESLESEFLLQARTVFQAPDIDGITYITEGFAPTGEITVGRINQVHEYDLFASLNDNLSLQTTP
jgi:ribosomal protein S12 methylthiotransferase